MLATLLPRLLAAVVILSPGTTVRWTAPVECPGARVVERRVATLLAEGGSERRDPTAIDLAVTPTKTGYRLRVDVTTPDGPLGSRIQHLDHASCDDVVEVAALIAALTIDPNLAEGSPSTTHPDPESGDPIEDAVPDVGEMNPRSPTAPTVVVPAPDAQEHPSSSEGLALPLDETSVPPTRDDVPAPPRGAPPVEPLGLVELGIGMGRLATPLPMILVRGGFGLDIDHARVVARLSGVGPSTATLESTGAGGWFGLATAGVAACGQSMGRWRVVGCVASDVGVAIGRGRNTIVTRTRTSIWWGLEAEVGVEVALRPHVGLAFRIDGGWVPASPQFLVEEQGKICCSAWGAGARVGVVLRRGRVGNR